MQVELELDTFTPAVADTLFGPPWAGSNTASAQDEAQLTILAGAPLLKLYALLSDRGCPTNWNVTLLGAATFGRITVSEGLHVLKIPLQDVTGIDGSQAIIKNSIKATNLG